MYLHKWIVFNAAHARMSFTKLRRKVVTLKSRWLGDGSATSLFPPKQSQAVARRLAIGRLCGGGAVVARAQGRQFSREQCQMVHLSRWVRSPLTAGAALLRTFAAARPHRPKVDGRQLACFTALNPPSLASAVCYRWIIIIIVVCFGFSAVIDRPISTLSFNILYL